MSEVACAVIADDLTGACDAAVQFARRGAQTVVSLGSRLAPASVMAVSTESRDANETDIATKLRNAAQKLAPFRPSVLFKKIDSTLRGKVGLEIAVAMEVFECDQAVVTPAFPALGRVVRGGRLCVDADPAFEPIEVLAHLHQHAGFDAERALTFDAICNEDLRSIAARFLNDERRILWAGSGGLADALAAELFGDTHQPVAAPALERSLVFCIGSDHAATRRQEMELVLRHGASVLLAEDARPENLSGSIVRVTASGTSRTVFRDLLSRAAPQIGGLFLCGGDTASLVCAAVEADRIELRDELLPGVPSGVLRGGVLDGKTVVTKSGGFGMPDTLVRIAEAFSVRV